MTDSKTKYMTLTGKAFWCKVYTPDEFRGSSKWMLNLYMDDPKEWAKFKEAGIQKKVKEDENGKSFAVTRNTSKMIKGSMVYFAPPVIYDKDGRVLVQYVDEKGSPVRSYNNPDQRPTRVGEPVLIGNGSTVSVRLSVYPTAMGPGNRLESITLLDLIHYEKPEELQENREVKGPEVEVTNDELTGPPW